MNDTLDLNITTLDYLNTSLAPSSLNSLTSLPVMDDIFTDSLDLLNSTINDTLANLTLSNSTTAKEEEEKMCPIPEEELDMCHLQVSIIKQTVNNMYDFNIITPGLRYPDQTDPHGV